MRAILAAELKIFVVLGAMILSALAGARISSQSPYAAAQAVTPAPWLSIAGPFNFCYRYPETVGCAPAEDKTGDPFVRGYKVDVDRARADCLHWGAVGAVPAAFLTRDAACSGGIRLAGGIYWFSEPARQTPPPLTPSPPVLPIPPAATVSPAPKATATPTATPGPVIPLPTLSPSQLHSFTVSCNPPGSPMKVTIYGSRELVWGVDRDWCGPLYTAFVELLRRLSETQPARVEVRD